MKDPAVHPVKVPTSVLVLSIIEIALGLLAIGLVLTSQANRFPSAPLYLTAYGYVSGLFLAGTLGLLSRGLLSPSTSRSRRVSAVSRWVAIAAFAMTAGYSLLSELADWTALPSCNGCPSPAPTLNQVLSSVVLDIGGGALAALMPIISFVLMRHRLEATPAPPPAPPAPPGAAPASPHIGP
jgi:hypothetical protein